MGDIEIMKYYLYPGLKDLFVDFEVEDTKTNFDFSIEIELAISTICKKGGGDDEACYVEKDVLADFLKEKLYSILLRNSAPNLLFTQMSIWHRWDPFRPYTKVFSPAMAGEDDKGWEDSNESNLYIAYYLPDWEILEFQNTTGIYQIQICFPDAAPLDQRFE